MKKVLIVAYHFPPSDAVGALRPAKFAEYLPEFGWDPVVLAASAGEGERTPCQFEAMRGVRVETVAAWRGLRDLAGSVETWRRAGRAGKHAGPAEHAAAEAGWRTTYQADEARRNPVRDLLYSLMWLPDDRHGWILPATLRGLALIRRERPHALFVTSPPHSAQVVGLLLARLSGVPLVADFRDPWVGNPATPAFILSGPTPWIHDFLEAQVLSAAAAVVTATRSHSRSLAARRSEAREKLRFIPNGFDAEMFEGLAPPAEEPERFLITYAGNLYHTRTPAPLFEAMGILREEHGVPASRIRVNLVGDCEYAGAASVREMAKAAGCEESLRLTGRLPHREALAELVRSDLLLLLAAGQPEQIPAKAYEYAAAGPPILALVEPGATAEFLEDAATADVLYGADPRAIASVVLARLRNGTTKPPGDWRMPARVARYDRRALTSELAGVLDALGRA